MGQSYAKKTFGGENHVRREHNVRTTPKILSYLGGLNISTQRDTEYGGEDTLSTSLVRKKATFPRLVFCKVKVLAWEVLLHSNEIEGEDK